MRQMRVRRELPSAHIGLFVARGFMLEAGGRPGRMDNDFQ